MKKKKKKQILNKHENMLKSTSNKNHHQDHHALFLMKQSGKKLKPTRTRENVDPFLIGLTTLGGNLTRAGKGEAASAP